MRRLADGLTRLTAALALVALVVAVPAVVLATVGPPDLSVLDDAIRTGRLGDEAVVQIGLVLFVLLWAWFAATAASEAVRVVAWRGQRRPVALEPTSGSPTGWVRHLVRVALISTTAVVGSGLAPLVAGSGVRAAVPPPATALHAPHPSSPLAPSAPSTSTGLLRSAGRDTPYSVAVRLGDPLLRDRIIELNTGRPTPTGATWSGGVFPDGMEIVLPAGLPGREVVGWHRYTVVEGDSVYRIAARLAAQLPDRDGRRVRELADEIIDRNLGTVMLDGARFEDPSLIRIGWQIEVPELAGAPEQPSVAPLHHVVEPGDSYWAIADDHLASSGAPTEPDDVAAFSAALVRENAPLLGHDHPALLVPGDVVTWGRLPVAPGLPAVADVTVDPVTRPTTAPATATAPATDTDTATPPTSTSTSTSTVPAASDDAVPDAATVTRTPLTTSLGAAVLLCAGALGLIESRRRHQLRRADTDAVLEPPADTDVATERLLRTLDAPALAVRLDLALRVAGHLLTGSGGHVLAAVAGADGTITLVLDRDGRVPLAPFTGDDRLGPGAWQLAPTVATEDLAPTARLAGQPCPALAHIGTLVPGGGGLFVDLEAAGLVCVDGPAADTAAVLHTLAASLAASPVGETLRLVTHDLDTTTHLGNPDAEDAASLDDALDRAASSLGSTPTAIGSRRTFELRARGTGGEAWEPVVVVSGATDHDPQVLADAVAVAHDGGRGLAVVLATPVEGAGLTLRASGSAWVLEPLGLGVVPVGIDTGHLAAVHHLLDAADRPLPARTEPATLAGLVTPAGPVEPAWDVLVRVLGQVCVTDRAGTRIRFERGKALELVVWLAHHRDRPTRSAARTALWDLAVRDATFANVVSDARRTLARAVTLPDAGTDWIGRTLTDDLPLHPHVVTDADLLRARLAAAQGLDHRDAIAALTPAVELITDLPFAGTGYLWPDAEGITSALTLLATRATSELARHHLALGDVDGVFDTTARALQVLPGHEESIALRMRAHAQRGDHAGVRHEWEAYERALHADAWSSGEPSPQLAAIRRELAAACRVPSGPLARRPGD